MSVQFLKPAGLRVMTSRTDTAVNRKSKIPWYVYFVGGVIYTVLAVMLFAESALPSGMDLRHQCTVRLLLCQGGLEPG